MITQAVFQTTFLLMMTSMPAADCPARPEPKLTVALDNVMAVDQFLLAAAQEIVNRRFAELGVKVQWRFGTAKATGCGERLTIVFDAAVPDGFTSDAVGYATVGKKGTPIRLFYCRVTRQSSQALRVAVLGYTMVHEITHMIEGEARHSCTGIMKAQWDYRDRLEMLEERLLFAEEDKRLVRAHFGLPIETPLDTRLR
jgi:hypothetical protein